MPEACRAVGHKGHMLLVNQIRMGHMPPPLYAPDEIQNSMFLSSGEKRSHEGHMEQTKKTSLALVIIRYSTLPNLLPVMPQGQKCFRGGRFFFHALRP